MITLFLSAHPNEFEFALIRIPENQIMACGSVTSIGEDFSVLEYVYGNHHPIKMKKIFYDYHNALKEVFKWLQDEQYGVLTSASQINYIIHRVVYCCNAPHNPARITPAILKMIEEGISLAPLHNNSNLLLIKSAMAMVDHPHFAFFDNCFFNDMPAYNSLYALPTLLNQKLNIRKLGFHGIQHHDNLKKTAELLNKPESKVNMISCYLGRGITLAAIREGKACDSDSGYSTLSGIPTLHKSGSFDPAIVLFLLENNHYPLTDLKTMLYSQSGLQSMIHQPITYRDLFENAHPADPEKEELANYFVMRVSKEISRMLPNFSRLDALAFSGEIVLAFPELRSRLIRQLSFLKIKLDPESNRINQPGSRISTKDSSVNILIFENHLFLAMARIISENKTCLASLM
ncbi:MAG: acetate/propionate family kinase [Candidatus Delongbacteria bacterium]|nr:acetate/propionate family kinase [Candidatus Delongbacteria bacterium]